MGLVGACPGLTSLAAPWKAPAQQKQPGGFLGGALSPITKSHRCKRTAGPTGTETGPRGGAGPRDILHHPFGSATGHTLIPKGSSSCQSAAPALHLCKGNSHSERGSYSAALLPCSLPAVVLLLPHLLRYILLLPSGINPSFLPAGMQVPYLQPVPYGFSLSWEVFIPPTTLQMQWSSPHHVMLTSTLHTHHLP